ncbi:MAG: PQQ-binding-like beta-propeller repeat protein, partial [Acidobacteriota bacterium]
MKIRRVTLLILLLTFATSQQTSARPTGERPPGMLPVTYERLLRAEQEPENWLTYSGQYHGQRYSRLTQINRNNVHLLRVSWVYQTGIVEKVETTPLVVDGVMYLTQPPSDVIALDAKTGRPYWSYHPILSDQLTICCGKVNRGVAILGEKIYLATLDARLIALDAKSGNVVWDVQIADPQSGYSSTAAPLAVKDKIVTGIAGGEFGIRGFVDAYDAETGKRVWRFHTIPRAGEAGSDTWEGDSWKTGGSPTWVTGSFDPELNLIYWGTGNPSPAWDGEVREGDNLYSNSIVALDADTGKLKWYFQFTPHDTHDWDACQIPVLVDAEFRGRLRKLMLWPNRNAFYYVLDRETGEFLLAREFAKQTWAEKIDQNGRPIVKPNTDPSPEGTLVYPSSNGAANWWSPSYSPIAGLVYVTAYDGADIYY